MDLVATIREQIDVLAVQKELQCLGENLKIEFKDVFSEVPHLDELHIKLKDVLKTFQT